MSCVTIYSETCFKWHPKEPVKSICPVEVAPNWKCSAVNLIANYNNAIAY